MKSFLLTTVLFSCCLGCRQNGKIINIDDVAIDYVKLGLYLGQYDTSFVDAYYGPDLVRNYVEAYSGVPENGNTRWQVFSWLLSNLVTPEDLLQE